MSIGADNVDVKTIQEQQAWEHYKAIEDENYHLKRQLRNKNDQLRKLKASYRSLNEKYKKLNESRKPRFRNKGKKRV